MSDSDGLDALVRRLRAAAAVLDSDEPAIGPPLGAWHQRLIQRRDFPHRLAVPDPQHPRLAELMAVEHDTAAFLDSAYRHLLGRSPDPEGLAHYQTMAQQRGRLVVLVELARAGEAREYRERQAIALPSALARLLGWRERLERLGRLRGAALRLWAKWLARRARRHGPRWELEAELRRLSADMRSVADAVLELHDRQHHFGARQDHEYARQQALWQRLASLVPAHAPAQPPPARPSEQQSGQRVALPDGFSAFLDACETALIVPAADTGRFQGDCARARIAGADARDLGGAPSPWLESLERWGFAASRIEGEPVAALLASPAGTLALISGFRQVGRLPLPRLYALVAAARHALAPGGMLLLAVPPPQAPTLGEPPPAPDVVELLLRFHGFTDLAWRPAHSASGAPLGQVIVAFRPREGA